MNETIAFYIPAVVNTLFATGRLQCWFLRTPASRFGVTHHEDGATVIEGIRIPVARRNSRERPWK